MRGVDLDVAAGEVVCLVGESGSGKSMTALALCGLQPGGATLGGELTVCGTDVRSADPARLRRLRGEAVGFVFQDPATTLNPVLPVGRQVAEGPVVHRRIPAGAAASHAATLLQQVEIADPGGRARQYPHQFSGGMRQRAVLAMAIAGHPRLIIADEPTTALDVTVQAQILDLLRRRRAELGASVLLITHDLGVVAEMADRVLVMYAGRIVEASGAAGLFARPGHPYTAALLRSVPRLDRGGARLEPIPGAPPSLLDLAPGCSFQPRCALSRGRAVCRELRPELRAAPGGGQAACHFAEELAAPAEIAPARTLRAAVPSDARPLLEVTGLTVRFPVRSRLLRRTIGAVQAVDALDLRVREGETLGLVGESGCGKTTAARAMVGLVAASAGLVRLAGAPITGLSRQRMKPIRRQVQYVFQDPYSSLNPALTVGELIAEPMRIHRVYDALGGARRVAELLDRTGLPAGSATRRARDFSGGQRQRIGIARALALQPRLLVLDEPVAALDVSIQAQIVNLLADLQAEFGLGYLFIAHDLAVVRHVSHRVAVMYLGRLVEENAAERLYAQPAHPYTSALLSAVPQPEVGRAQDRIVLPGEPPNPAHPPPGCAFHPRCARRTARCTTERPLLRPAPVGGGSVACHHPNGPDAEAWTGATGIGTTDIGTTGAGAAA